MAAYDLVPVGMKSDTFYTYTYAPLLSNLSGSIFIARCSARRHAKLGETGGIILSESE